MVERIPLIDATVFMGMHHEDPHLRARTLAFFTERYDGQVRMNFSQIGLCDAIIWKKDRALQDVYYPFMDVLHSDMDILRVGYSEAVLDRAANDPALTMLSPVQRLQAAQVLESESPFYTHDPDYARCEVLRPFLARFDDAPSTRGFPTALQALYQASLALRIATEDFRDV